MTATEKYEDEKKTITQAVKDGGISLVLYNKHNIPKSLPAAILTLNEETGKNGTSKRYTDTDISWTLYLIVNSENVDDPDAVLYPLKEAIREKYQTAMHRDFPDVVYYDSRLDPRLVRIAKIELTKPGSGVSS